MPARRSCHPASASTPRPTRRQTSTGATARRARVGRGIGAPHPSRTSTPTDRPLPHVARPGEIAVQGILAGRPNPRIPDHPLRGPDFGLYGLCGGPGSEARTRPRSRPVTATEPQVQAARPGEIAVQGILTGRFPHPEAQIWRFLRWSSGPGDPELRRQGILVGRFASFGNTNMAFTAHFRVRRRVPRPAPGREDRPVTAPYPHTA